ncbi:MAG TPA: hypothetical protein VKA54_07540 [Gemmatimonadaceae bacterium]|nr:hypothetical protein [Gemmatimonadaceae bacterium]
MRPRGNTQEDYLLRMIRQAAELLRQLRRRLLGGEESAETIRQDAAAAIDFLLGGQAPVLGMLDPASAVRLVGHPALVDLWTALLDVEADAAESSGDAPVAARRRARTRALREAAQSLWGPIDGDTIDAGSPAPMERPES